MEEVKARAQRELRAQLRAVTPEDYEHLAKRASRAVARVKCNTPRGGDGRLVPGTVEILIVPAASDALRAGDLSRLYVDKTLAKTVEGYLDQRRLLTTILHIGEPGYVGIQVQAQIVPSEYSRPEIIATRVREALRDFLSPLPLAEDPEKQEEMMGANWEGWPFGRDLYLAEIFSLIQRVAGVKHVLDVQLSQRSVSPNKERPAGGEGEQRPADRKLTPVNENVVRVPANTLLCSLDHEITIAELEEADD